MSEVRVHCIELLATNRGVGMEIKPHFNDLKLHLLRGSSKASPDLLTVLNKTHGKMFHTDELSGWGIVTNEASVTADKARVRRLAHSMAEILGGYGYEIELEDNLG